MTAQPIQDHRTVATIENVRNRISVIEDLNARGVGTALWHQQFELACLRALLAAHEQEPVGEVVLGEYDDCGDYPDAKVVCIAAQGQADWNNFRDGTKLYADPVVSELHAVVSEVKPLVSEQELVVNDAMALAFHYSLTDGTASRDDLDEIKTGLRAALANYTHTAPVPAVPDEQALSDLRERLADVVGVRFSNDDDVLAIFNACRAAMLNGGKS